MALKYILTQNTISLNLNGKHVTLTNQDKRYPDVYRLIKEGRTDEIEEVLNRKEKPIEEYVQGSELFLENGLLRDKEGNVLPDVLNRRVQEMKDEGFSIQHMALFWKNLKDNPSLRSREQLYKFLEQNGHPITPDGHFVAYRGIRNDFKDCHTGTFDNTPGNVLEMPRRDVDDDPTRTCSRGFHVAAFGYANSFGQVTVEVKVNPRDVVAVPTDYNGQKMRVCRFEVVQVCERMNEDVVYSEQGIYNFPSGGFDAYEEDEDPGVDEEDVESILEWAEEFGDRYRDRASLAARIEEEMYWLNATEILGVINDNLG